MGTFVSTDVEGPVRDWLRLQATDALGRVYLNNPGCPKDGSGNPLSFITLAKVTNAPEGGDLRLEWATISFSCWAGKKADASRLGSQLSTLLESLPVGVVMGTAPDDIVFLGASVELGPIPMPDPDLPGSGQTARSRYVVDVAIRFRPA